MIEPDTGARPTSVDARGAPEIGIDSCVDMKVCGVGTLGQLNLPSLVDTLHLQTPLSIHFSCLFPSLSSLSFSELLDLSGKFLKSNVLDLAAAAAVSSVATDPSTCGTSSCQAQR